MQQTSRNPTSNGVKRQPDELAELSSHQLSTFSTTAGVIEDSCSISGIANDRDGGAVSRGGFRAARAKDRKKCPAISQR